VANEMMEAMKTIAVVDADGNWTTKVVSTVYENHQDSFVDECKM
jgi:hypothetical protein